MYRTTVEATKGEQLKVTRERYLPGSNLLAAGWLLVSSYMTTSLAKAPRKLAQQPWVQQLQQASAGLPLPYANTAFGNIPPRAAVQASKPASVPAAQQPVTEPVCVHCDAPRRQHYHTGACFTGQNSFMTKLGDLEGGGTVYIGLPAGEEGAPVHREMGRMLNNEGCVVHAQPETVPTPAEHAKDVVRQTIEEVLGGTEEIHRDY